MISTQIRTIILIISISMGIGGCSNGLPTNKPKSGINASDYEDLRCKKSIACEGKAIIISGTIDNTFGLDSGDEEIRIHNVILGDLDIEFLNEYRGKDVSRGSKAKIYGYIDDDGNIVNAHINITMDKDEEDRKRYAESRRIEREAAQRYVKEMNAANAAMNSYIENKEAELKSKAVRIEVHQVAGVAAKSYHMSDGRIVTCYRRAGRVGLHMECEGE